MKTIFLDLNENIPSFDKLAIALGNFDSMHLGHQRLLIETSLSDEPYSSILLFDPPSPFKGEGVICSLEDKLLVASKLRLDYAFVIKTNDEFWKLNKDEFISKLLLPLGVSSIYCGSDFRFGKDGAGSIADLKSIFNVKEVDFILDDDKKISSSNLKTLIKVGDMEKVSSLLGRHYEIKGKVEEGFHNGRKIGFPTANLRLVSPYIMPKNGVYGGISYVNGIPYLSLVNVGTNPTIGELVNPKVETHLLNFNGNLYGSTLYLSFLYYIREEMKFASLDELKSQIEKDKLQIQDKWEEMQNE